MKQIYLITEGNPILGMGHVTRCGALAEAFREKGCQTFLVAGESPVSMDFPGSLLSYPLAKACQQGGWQQQDTRDALAKVMGLMALQAGDPEEKVMVLDRYDLSPDWVLQLKHTAHQVGYLDDYHHRISEADFLVNHQVGAEEELQPGGFYENLSIPMKLAGGQYALLRNDFRDLPIKELGETVLNVLIMTGGGNQKGWQEKLLQWTWEIYPKLEAMASKPVTLHLLTGAQGPLFHTWEQQTQNLQGIQVYPRMAADQVAAMMKKMDLAISAGGGTVYELAAWGVPTLALVLAENQEPFVNAMEKRGLVRSLGGHKRLDSQYYQKMLLSATEDLLWRQTSSRKMQRLVDGRGPERVAAALLANNNR
ncbi:PseG/SpsG family protein [Anoxynatronum buryatiense]|nr:glycosyltransferase [Anoxynatronum buryatiense]